MRKKIDQDSGLIRVALYIRVSGEEQKIKGLSLDAQQERLEAYAHERGWIIVGVYVDAAKTARKEMHKRLEFQKMIQSVQRDEIDILLFCRLDRWFRSVGDYYKVIEILEAHNCNWKTTDEEYDTTTANGRLYINMKLSIAQNEADIDGERIDVVFDSKIAHGTVVSGNAPFGYKVNREKKLEIVPENAAIVQDAFNHYEETISKRGTITYIREKYGVNWCEATFRRMLREQLYTGVYDRGNRRNDNFCQPIIDRSQFDQIQKLLKRNIRQTPTRYIYIFTSLLVCNECKHKLVGYRSGDYYYYRCNYHHQRAKCPHNRTMPEQQLENWLINHLDEELDKCRLQWNITNAERKKNKFVSDKAAIKKKLTKLKELYVNDLISMDEYRKDHDIYTAALNQIQDIPTETPPDFSAIEMFLKSDYKNLYENLTREERCAIWHSVISEIHIDNDRNITGIYFG